MYRILEYLGCAGDLNVLLLWFGVDALMIPGLFKLLVLLSLIETPGEVL